MTTASNSSSPAGPTILALDIGTSSIKAMLFDAAGQAVPGTDVRQANAIDLGPDGAMETDPDALLEAVWGCLDAVLAQAGPLAGSIAGVCCCTFVSNGLGIDAAGQAVTPLVLYGDTRAAQQADELRARLDEAYFHQITGTRFHASYLPARFLWWQQAQPEAFARAARWVSIGEYLLLKLFGDAAVSYSVASWTGLLDRTRLDWDDELLAHLPVRREQLGRLVDADHAWQGLGGAFAARWPALARVPWFPAVGDGAAANLGSGCTAPDRVAISMGTSSAARTVITAPALTLPPGLWCYRVDRRRALLGGAMTEGGSVFAWLQKLLNLSGITDLEGALAVLPPGAGGLAFLPLISGERSPGWASDARGVLMGLSAATTPLELLRAGLEGVACRIALVYRLLRPALPADPLIVASGGAIQNSPVWQQILADALGCPVRLAAAAETSTRGAALLALEALKIIPDLAQLPDDSLPAAEPDAGRHQVYQEVMAHQKAMYDALVGQ